LLAKLPKSTYPPIPFEPNLGSVLRYLDLAQDRVYLSKGMLRYASGLILVGINVEPWTKRCVHQPTDVLCIEAQEIKTFSVKFNLSKTVLIFFTSSNIIKRSIQQFRLRILLKGLRTTDYSLVPNIDKPQYLLEGIGLKDYMQRSSMQNSLKSRMKLWLKSWLSPTNLWLIEP
jgi:hypothetical protein